MLLWLVMTTALGAGSLCALRVGSIDLEAAELLILRNLFQAAGRLVEKDTKTHARSPAGALRGQRGAACGASAPLC